MISLELKVQLLAFGSLVFFFHATKEGLSATALSIQHEGGGLKAHIMEASAGKTQPAIHLCLCQVSSVLMICFVLFCAS